MGGVVVIVLCRECDVLTQCFHIRVEFCIWDANICTVRDWVYCVQCIFWILRQVHLKDAVEIVVQPLAPGVEVLFGFVDDTRGLIPLRSVLRYGVS